MLQQLLYERKATWEQWRSRWACHQFKPAYRGPDTVIWGGWWSFCAAKLGSCWFKHNTETAKQSPGNQGILPTQKSKNSKLFSDFIISLKLTDNSSRLHGLISLLQKPKRLKRDYILIVVSPGYTESGNPGHWLTRILMLPFKSRHNRYKEQESRSAFSESTQWSVFMCPNPNAQMPQDVSNIYRVVSEKASWFTSLSCTSHFPTFWGKQSKEVCRRFR